MSVSTGVPLSGITGIGITCKQCRVTVQIDRRPGPFPLSTPIHCACEDEAFDGAFKQLMDAWKELVGTQRLVDDRAELSLVHEHRGG